VPISDIIQLVHAAETGSVKSQISDINDILMNHDLHNANFWFGQLKTG